LVSRTSPGRGSNDKTLGSLMDHSGTGVTTLEEIHNARLTAVELSRGHDDLRYLLDCLGLLDDSLASDAPSGAADNLVSFNRPTGGRRTDS
jgi:hypothetical protein